MEALLHNGGYIIKFSHKFVVSNKLLYSYLNMVYLDRKFAAHILNRIIKKSVQKIEKEKADDKQ
jgi:hypothetical protein